MERVTISFPGLGIGNFDVNKIAFSIGSLHIRWYALVITTGIVLAFLYTYYRGKKNEGIILDDILDVGLITVVSGIVGARAYYVITTWGNYPTFLDVIAIWKGGLGIYGAIIAGGAAVILTCIYKKLNFKKFLDMVAPGVMIAQALGRWGNFFNGEAHGRIVEEGNPLYFMRMGLLPNDFSSQMVYVHPTFFYESLWNVIGFVLINLFYKKKKFDGQICLMYLTWYGFGRMFIETLRTDSLLIINSLGDGYVFNRISVVVGLLCFVGGAAALVTLFILQKKGMIPVVDVSAPPVIGEEADATDVNEEKEEKKEKEEDQDNG